MKQKETNLNGEKSGEVRGNFPSRRRLRTFRKRIRKGIIGFFTLPEISDEEKAQQSSADPSGPKFWG